MTGNSGKRVALGIGAAVFIILLAVGAYWFMSRHPKPVVAKPQLAIVGVGLFLGRNQETHKFEVRKVFPNSPAEKAGLFPGLILNKVNNIVVEEKTIKELSALLMGAVGTKVIVEVIDSKDVTNDVEIICEQFINRSTQ
jgi:C-terminal processing protease CtpA/Prc